MEDERQVNPSEDGRQVIGEILEWRTPPTRDLEFETPKARMWEHWVEALKDNPDQWAKLPYRRNDLTKASVKKSLQGLPGVEIVEEGEELYARYSPRQDTTLVTHSQSTPITPLASLTPLAPARAASDAAEKIARITSGGGQSIMEPVTTPLSGGREHLFDDIAGPIIGEG